MTTQFASENSEFSGTDCQKILKNLFQQLEDFSVAAGAP